MALRRISKRAEIAAAGLLAVLAATVPNTESRAAVTISGASTANMKCGAHLCRATAEDAVLNATDLQVLLAAGSVTVQSLRTAKDIVVDAPVTWGSGVTLTLDAYRSLTVKRPIAVTGVGGLSILINDGGSLGIYAFDGAGRVTFASLSSPLTINNRLFTLVNSPRTLAGAIGANPYGFYALANRYNAHQDGIYENTPVPFPFNGEFDGLGNTIENLAINTKAAYAGLFYEMYGTVEHLRLTQIHFDVRSKSASFAGGLAAFSGGVSLYQVSVDGSINIGGVLNETTVGSVGGLVGQLFSGLVSNCVADVDVTSAAPSQAGGLDGINYGGAISNSYSTGSVTLANAEGFAGGLVGYLQAMGAIYSSYSTGVVSSPAGGVVGGVIGKDMAGANTYDYWDISTSGITSPSQGAGAPANDPGITGLTTTQLQAGLPAGFDPAIWGEDPNINDGLPYLRHGDHG